MTERIAGPLPPPFGVAPLFENFFESQRRSRPRDIVDGFNEVAVTADMTDQEMARSARFATTRGGWITAVGVRVTESRTTGTMTAEVWRNTGAPGGAGVRTGLTVELNATFTQKNMKSADFGIYRFEPMDELFVALSTSSWAPITADAYVSMEVAFD